MDPELQLKNRKIFISYRRKDHPEFAKRIRDHIANQFGRDNVFMDFDSIEFFSDFASYIRQTIQECDVVIAVIGPRWMELLKEKERQQDSKDDEPDYVRVELALALELRKVVAPLCILDAKPPNPDDLPTDMREMMRYNVASIQSDATFYDTMDRILISVEQAIRERETERKADDVVASINEFYRAYADREWHEAAQWLDTITKFSEIPSVFPLANFKAEIAQRIVNESDQLAQRRRAEKEYSVIRSMANNPAVSRSQVWTALQTLWKTYPGYDPDSLARAFRQPLPLDLSLEFVNEALHTWSENDGRWQTTDWDADTFELTFAMYDDVDATQHLPLSVDLMAGNIAIVGTVGTGKSTALKSIAMSLAVQYAPTDVHLYLLDNNIQLSAMAELPHVGAYISFDNSERLERLSYILDDAIDQRRSAFRRLGSDTIRHYNRHPDRPQPMPHIVLIIDDFYQFRQLRQTDDVLYEAYRDTFLETSHQVEYMANYAQEVAEYEAREAEANQDMPNTEAQKDNRS